MTHNNNDNRAADFTVYSGNFCLGIWKNIDENGTVSYSTQPQRIYWKQGEDKPSYSRRLFVNDLPHSVSATQFAQFLIKQDQLGLLDITKLNKNSKQEAVSIDSSEVTNFQ